eukprot:Gregarina_sp_Poly_1__9752@NODE_620_length_7097_cov_138_674395_g475_i0_p8_GENE_NODE_620_length_7097_cov_138_674395_g475_i0NODE_620_length_7097_cov_138_674395_g475_i0_p8_ORF_typecomplete_len131_score11_52_NODE_620_length_7097_cov_138_674395_g475_i040104402
MAPNGSLIPLYSTMSSPFHFGPASGSPSHCMIAVDSIVVGESHEGGQPQDLMAVLQAMTHSGLRGDQLGPAGSLRSNEWSLAQQEWVRTLTEAGVEKRKSEHVPTHAAYMTTPAPKHSLLLPRSLEAQVK